MTGRCAHTNTHTNTHTSNERIISAIHFVHLAEIIMGHGSTPIDPSNYDDHPFDPLTHGLIYPLCCLNLPPEFSELKHKKCDIFEFGRILYVFFISNPYTFLVRSAYSVFLIYLFFFLFFSVSLLLSLNCFFFVSTIVWRIRDFLIRP